MKIDIKYKYSIDYEVERILNTIKKIKWYEKNQYRLTFPKGINLKNNKNLTENDIKKVVTKEYKESQYKDIVLQLQKEWEPIVEKITNNLLLNNLNPKKEYLVSLTRYGVGGSYQRPNKIIINYCNCNNLLKTIIHEIIHLSIETLIQKYKIEHWTKERIVDLILLKVYPKWKKTQRVPIKTDKIDKIFYNYFPDIEKVISNISC